MSAADLCAALGYTCGIIVCFGVASLAVADIRRGPERTALVITGIALLAIATGIGVAAIWVAAGTGILS